MPEGAGCEWQKGPEEGEGSRTKRFTQSAIEVRKRPIHADVCKGTVHRGGSPIPGGKRYKGNSEGNFSFSHGWGGKRHQLPLGERV